MKGSDIPNKVCPTCQQNMIKIVGLPSHRISYECYCNKQETVINKDYINIEHRKYRVHYSFEEKIFRLHSIKTYKPLVHIKCDEDEVMTLIGNIQQILKDYEMLK